MSSWNAPITPQSILFFSRGKGRGHAVPDAAIADELVSRDTNLKITFVSYSLGAVVLRELGWDVIDLGLPEDNLLWDAVIGISRVLREHRPSIVISHEEFAAIPVAKAFGLPSVFLTDWFVDPGFWPMQAIRYADEVLFLDDPGYYDEPSYLRGKIRYVGCVLRKLVTDEAARSRSRSALGIPLNSTVVLVVPGGADFHSEDRAPMFDLIVNVFEGLPISDKHLVWVVGKPDYDVLAARSSGHSNVRILAPNPDFTSMLMAADLVMTKGNRTPLFECEALGIPSISISFGSNPIDDCRAVRIPTNTALRAKGIDRMVLRNYMLAALATP